MTRPRVIVVAKRSAYGRFLEDEDPRIRTLLRRRDPSVRHWKRAFGDHQRAVQTVLDSLEALGARAVLARGAHRRFATLDAVLIVTVGGDGTLLAASSNVSTVPVLGVNSSPTNSVGFFCAARRESVREMLAAALEGTLPSVRLTRMQVEVNGHVRSRRVLNDALFCHESPAATSRYVVRIGSRSEEHRSSGVWVGTAAGSTAAQRSAGGRILPLTSSKLQLVVREPYAPRGKRYRLVRAVLDRGATATLHSKMSDARLFLDGPHESFVLRLGDEVRFRASDEPLTVLGISRRRNAAK